MASRRKFLAAAAAGSAVAFGAPLVITAQKTDTKLIVGEGEHKFEVHHEWPQLPDKFTWQTVEYQIIKVKPLAPAGQNVMFELQVRR